MKWKKAEKIRKMCRERMCDGCKYDSERGGSACEAARHGFIPRDWKKIEFKQAELELRKMKKDGALG